MLKQIICGTVLLCSAGFSSAGMVAQEFNIPLQITNLNKTFTYDLFDDKNGQRTLESVEISLNAKASGTSEVENRNKGATRVTANLSAIISLRDLVGNTIVSTRPSASKSEVLAGFDGQTDFAGPSGTQFLNINASLSANKTFFDPLELASYIATSTTTSTVDFTAAALSYMCGGGNIASGFLTMAGGDFSIVYSYSEIPINVSAPAQIALLGFGVFVLVALRKSKA